MKRKDLLLATLALLALWQAASMLVNRPILPSPVEVAAVDEALLEYLEWGVAPAEAFGRLGRLEQPVRDALDRSEVRRRGLLVPKLTPWAVGSDLAR